MKLKIHQGRQTLPQETLLDVNNTDFPCGLEKKLQSPIVVAGASSLFKMMKPINISDDDDLVKKF